MITLRLHREVYDDGAVGAAIKVYESFAAFDRAAEGEHWVVRVTSPQAARERRVAGEFANYALGLTVKGLRGAKT